jgi:hypothetical protein
MREETIKRFFLGEVDGNALAKEASASVIRPDKIASEIAIEDMDGDFTLTRHHLLLLCEEGISGRIGENSLNAIAFSLIASDHFSWEEDDLIAEVLHDWSCPEFNYPLNAKTLEMNKDCLLGRSSPPDKLPPPPHAGQGKVISTRAKVSC